MSCNLHFFFSTFSLLFLFCFIFKKNIFQAKAVEESCKKWERESVSCHSYPQSVFHSYLNCPILAESGLDNGSFQAFMTRQLGRKEKLSALSPSQQIFSSSLIGLLYFFAELCLNPVPSYLASNHPTRLLWCQVWRERHSLSALAFRP